MAYGDYNGPDKPDKGHEGGSCNRGRCQSSPALYYNHGSFSWYCLDCRNQIALDPVNRRSWQKDFEPTCHHQQFETRAEMDKRKAEAHLYEEFDDCVWSGLYCNSVTAHDMMIDLMIKHDLGFMQNPGGGQFTHRATGFNCQVTLCDEVLDLNTLRNAIKEKFGASTE
ncbi:hypothetical protein CC53_gp128 [Rhizobium phage vB_RleS_L338C]|uniref:hypothetical protein n=1 Tax=Rhizobium phage vB_RleS_L338C TaxID=1414737 RepID=UPI0003D7E1FC|nr:hypothetical protein CC53_gp128 [Rhizobium phage vB_RleS_L338C]AHC30545.1 hypothetical protein L338C_128 [Rhizobium phage vB_RleS_L338C]QNH72096.1 hypothetical protein P11VFA_021 [Rhizobium phage P11VFA]